MKERQLSFWRTNFGRRLALALVAMLLALLAKVEIFGHNGYLALRQKEAAYRQEAARLARLQQENRDLHGDVRRLRSDPAAIERIAREQMHLTKPGEVVLTYDPAQLHAAPAAHGARPSAQ
ncbi:MAG: FtsB family cell division protein [Terriglobales bacterium]